MKLIDISIPLNVGVPEWPGDTPFSCGWSWDMADGASVSVSRWETSPHVGTHADAPLHVRPGAPGADSIPVPPFLGDVLVVDVQDMNGEISIYDLVARGWKTGSRRLLLKTGRTSATGHFPASWPSLSPVTAANLTEAGLTLLGVDAPSVDQRESKKLEVHHAIFDGGCYILENLDLTRVSPGPWELLALPLKVGPFDAAPVRAFLKKIGDQPPGA